ncbi:MAG: ADP-heptose synthase [Paenibacillaceae bacterium]|uniref:ADP-heptose synthase n=1 Tax=Paenibacillus mellifer TaxID=2937794 RepID=A0A9X1Y069_9BACL|nr:ADP-heptose synthase [Paenibacillus mellifer]MBW4841715.1 ADP-heptose synthase [Paenibacillaceae bacterium]MCK8488487.1 ADP-heptose synthase [Paenibacillus mellifer]
MSRRFVIEAVMVAIYGELLVPGAPVEYIVPYTTVMELYEFQNSPEPLMNDPVDDMHVKQKISELIAYLEEPLNRKKLERALTVPWSKSPSILFGEHVTWTVVNAVDNEQYGEFLDPIETEIVLTAQRENVPILTDQLELIRRIIEAEVPVQVYDIGDFEYAMEDNII